MSAPVDLRELAVDRTRRPREVSARRRPYGSRYLLPAAVVTGFVGLLTWSARESFVSRQAVTVVPVVVTRAEVQQEGAPLFQAAGWIEPRPTAINVPALTEGVVESLLVVEGSEVEAGQPVARLVDVDARLVVREAQSTLRLREAELATARANLKAARQRMETPVHLEAELADAESTLAALQTELAGLPFRERAGRARLDYAEQNLEGKRTAGEAVSMRVRQQAESELATAQAELEELQDRRVRLRVEVAAQAKRRDALGQQLELLIDETRALEDAQAQRDAAEARRDQAAVSLEKAELALERTVVRSSVAGRVMQLVAHPGTRVAGAVGRAGLGASTVVTLYDPKSLQVRADVRLENVPQVHIGQPVEIETASSSEPLRGHVLMATSAANVQKNTLEVKVAIEDPPATVRPEMLVTTTFLAPSQDGVEGGQQRDRERLLVPGMLVDDSEGGTSVWIVDASGNASRRSVQVGAGRAGPLVEVTEGLMPTDKLIVEGREGLEEGDPVVITEEDATLGMSNGS